MPDGTPDVDLGQVRSIVDRAVKAAVPADQMVERKVRPESEYSWPVPRPLAGLHAALTVVRLAQDQAYTFAKELRGQGSTWREIADLLEVPWSDEYSQVERAYELVAGPADHRRGAFRDSRVYWTCGGPKGCGKYVTDHGPYNGYPIDNEDGHADGCRRLADDMEAWEQEREEREARDRVMDEAMPLVTDSFGQESVQRARYVQTHGGRYQPWSTSESLMVALILHDDDQLRAHGYPKPRDAMQRILSGLSQPHQDPVEWLRILRLAATGQADA